LAHIRSVAGPTGLLKSADNDEAGQWLWFEDCKVEEVIGLLGVPAVLGSIDSDQEQTIRDLAGADGSAWWRTWKRRLMLHLFSGGENC
jgi:hypothetical protein